MPQGIHLLWKGYRGLVAVSSLKKLMRSSPGVHRQRPVVVPWFRILVQRWVAESERRKCKAVIDCRCYTCNIHSTDRSSFGLARPPTMLSGREKVGNNIAVVHAFLRTVSTAARRWYPCQMGCYQASSHSSCAKRASTPPRNYVILLVSGLSIGANKSATGFGQFHDI